MIFRHRGQRTQFQNTKENLDTLAQGATFRPGVTNVHLIGSPETQVDAGLNWFTVGLDLTGPLYSEDTNKVTLSSPAVLRQSDQHVIEDVSCLILIVAVKSLQPTYNTHTHTRTHTRTHARTHAHTHTHTHTL